MVSGTTNVAAGNFPVTIRVTDASTGPGSYFEVENYTLTVSPPPSVAIAVSPASVSEDGATNLTFTVTRSLNLTSPTLVNITTAGTATSGTDYTGNVATVTIPAGATSATISIDPAADTIVEPDETVTLTVAAGTGYTVGLPASATGTIANDDLAGPTLTLTKISQGGVGAFTFTGTNGWASQTITTTTSGVGVSGATQTLSTTGVVTALTEAAPPGYLLVGANCTGMGPGGTATLAGNTLTLSAAATAAGANIACTFTNARLPTLTLTKVSNGRVGTFTFVGTNGWASQTITTTTPGVGVTGATQTLASSSTSTSITENPASGFLLAGATCTGMAPGGMAILSGHTLALDSAATAAGANITCTFTSNDNLTDAVNDSYGPLNGASGATTPSVLLNDTLGGAPATVGAGGNVALTPGPAPTPPAGGIAMNPDGTITVAPGTTAGSYAYPYSLCAVADPTNCDTATATLGVSAAPIDAVDDAGTVPDGAVGGVAVPNVLVNDTLNGGPAPLSGVTLTQTVTSHPNVTLNPATGEVRAAPGTPAGTHTVVYAICEILNPTNCDSASVVVTVTDAPPVASNSALTVAYRAPATGVPLSLSGGAPTSLAITTPPTHGSAIVSGLTITYQPTSSYAGPDSFRYTASNAGGTSAAATVSVTVQDPVITITPSGGFSATAASPYTQTFTFNGGAQPWSGFQVTNLPAGLSVTGTTATTATISGTPTQAGTFNLNVSATDSSTGNGPYTLGQAFALTVAAPTLTLTPAGGTAFTGSYNTPFLQAFTAGGGVGPYAYAVSAGSLPSDLTLDPATGVLSGTPLAAWNVSFSITATDTGTTGAGAPFTVTHNYSFVSAAPTVTVSPATIPNAVPTVAYSQQLTASGGVGPYAFQLRTGSLPTGITLSGTGLISGTTTEVGAHTFSIRAIDAHGFDALPYPAYTLVVAPPTLTLTPAAGTLTAPYGVAYSQAFTAAGGSGSYTYTLGGTLPNGLGFSGGTLSGTPTAPGSYPITVTATDSVLTGNGAPFHVTQAYTLDVGASITLTPASLPAATAGVAYTQALSASGGASPYTFSVTAGSLPSGLVLASDGTLAGTPTASGNFSVTVQASDANSVGGSRSYTLVVGNATLDLTPTTLPNGSAGVAYAQTLGASGGVAPYRFAVTAGSLPLGLNLSSGGALGGTPTVAGTFAFTVTATDSTAGTAGSGSRAYSLTVAAPTITVDATLPAATVGQAYAAAATASGGVAPYTFAIAAGSLPPGLAIDAGGHVTGTPTAPGSYPVTLAATDTNGFRGTVAVVLTVQAAPVIEATPVPLDARWALLLVGLGLVTLGAGRLRAASRGSRP